ncbi:MAG: hypothetical protein ACYC9L_16250 [Sulfuricaulis sp.]
MYFASFSTLLACGFWRLVRDRFSQLARTFAREALQRVGRRARFARRAQAITASLRCNALSVVPHFSMPSHVVPSNYLLKRTAGVTLSPIRAAMPAAA